MYEFDVKKATEGCVEWIRGWFERNGDGCPAVIGISGGKDSSVAAALCAKALGEERVIGILMPNGFQEDIEYSRGICEFLKIKSYEINISAAVEGIYSGIGDLFPVTRQVKINLPSRIRMSVLYAVSQSFGGRVVNTCNLSEDWVGYSTRYGDSAGDFSPISCFTVTEIKKIGRYLGLPEKYIEKVPTDGLSGKTDEENLGFTYAQLDRYIREGTEPSPETKARIDHLHKTNLFKLQLMEAYTYQG